MTAAGATRSMLVAAILTGAALGRLPLQAAETCPALIPSTDAIAPDHSLRNRHERDPAAVEARRWWRRSGEARAPTSTITPIVADSAEALSIQLELHVEPTCDPVLARCFADELRMAINARPGFRITAACEPLAVQVAGGVDVTPIDGPILPLPFIEQEPLISPTDLLLAVQLRSIHPYRPMRVDAALELRDVHTGQVVMRIDDVWQSPTDSVVMRTTRQGWLRRNWRPTPVMSEGAALEANSPRLFLRGLAGQLAEGLAAGVPAVDSPTGSAPSVPAALHPPR